MTAEVRRFTTRDPAYRDSLSLRKKFLRAPLGLHPDANDVKGEAEQLHFGIFEGSRLLGSVTFQVLDEHRLKLRQMVVDESQRRTGHGSRLIRAAEEALSRLGYREIEMSARCTVLEFYRQLGYHPEGAIFTEVGIDHIRMTKRLSGPEPTE